MLKRWDWRDKIKNWNTYPITIPSLTTGRLYVGKWGESLHSNSTVLFGFTSVIPLKTSSTVLLSLSEICTSYIRYYLSKENKVNTIASKYEFREEWSALLAFVLEGKDEPQFPFKFHGALFQKSPNHNKKLTEFNKQKIEHARIVTPWSNTAVTNYSNTQDVTKEWRTFTQT